MIKWNKINRKRKEQKREETLSDGERKFVTFSLGQQDENKEEKKESWIVIDLKHVYQSQWSLIGLNNESKEVKE